MTAPSKSSISTARSRKWTSRTGRRSGRTAGWKPPKLPKTGVARSMSRPRTTRAAARSRGKIGSCGRARSTVSICSNDPPPFAAPASLAGRLRQSVHVHALGQQYESVPDLERHGGERASGARTRHAIASTLLEQGAVRAAKDERAVGREESVRQQIQRMTGVGTAVHVGAHRIPDPHHKAPERPVTGGDGECLCVLHAIAAGHGRSWLRILSSASILRRLRYTIISPGNASTKLIT